MSDSWIFHTKYIMMRLYDYYQDSRKTHVLNEMGLNLEYLMIRYLTRTSHLSASEEENSASVLLDLIVKNYEKISSDHFYAFFLDQELAPELFALVHLGCEEGILDHVDPTVCVDFKNLLSEVNFQPKSETEIKIKALGYRFFSSIFDFSEKLVTQIQMELDIQRNQTLVSNSGFTLGEHCIANGSPSSGCQSCRFFVDSTCTAASTYLNASSHFIGNATGSTQGAGSVGATDCLTPRVSAAHSAMSGNWDSSW
jgi:hypothetical protein